MAEAPAGVTLEQHVALTLLGWTRVPGKRAYWLGGTGWLDSTWTLLGLTDGGWELVGWGGTTTRHGCWSGPDPLELLREAGL